MKLSAVTSLLKYYPLPEALRTIAEAGYQGVELWGGMPHGFTDDFFRGTKLDRVTIERTRALLRGAGLAPVAFLPEQCLYPVNYLIGASPPFVEGHFHLRSKRYFHRALEVANALEIPMMLVTTPFWGWQKVGERFIHSHEKPLDAVVDFLGLLATRAERLGVVLVLEPLTHLETTAVETLDDLITVLDAVNSSALAAMLDTGHVHVTAQKLGVDSGGYFQEHVERLGPRLQHLHVDDNHGDLDAHLLPGEGSFDFLAAFQVLKAAGYAGYYSAELLMFGDNPVPPKPRELLEAARSYVMETWNRVL